MCTNCIEGKFIRTLTQNKCKLKNKIEQVDLLVADVIGPYASSVHEKRGVLIVMELARHAA